MAYDTDLIEDNVAEQAQSISYQLVSQVSASVAFGLAADRDDQVIDLKSQMLDALDMIADDMPLVEVEGQKWSQEQALENIESYLTGESAVQNLYTGLGRSELLKIYQKLQKTMTQYAMDTATIDSVIDDVKNYRVQTINIEEPAN